VISRCVISLCVTIRWLVLPPTVVRLDGVGAVGVPAGTACTAGTAIAGNRPSGIDIAGMAVRIAAAGASIPSTERTSSAP
jgi:hypothetical protein